VGVEPGEELRDLLSDVAGGHLGREHSDPFRGLADQQLEGLVVVAGLHWVQIL